MPSREQQPLTPRLVAVAGPREGDIFEVGERPFSIGRQSSNRLQLHHESVSRRHCVFEPTPDGVRLSDLESLCGTFVNGAPVRRRHLEHGDFIKVGDSLLLYLSGPVDDDANRSEHLAAGGYEVKSTVEMSVTGAFHLHPEQVREPLDGGDSKARHLLALLKISTEIHALRSVEDLARRLAEAVFQIAPAERVAVLWVDGDELRFMHAADRQGGEPRPRVSRTLAQRALRERVAVLSNDVLADNALTGIESLDAAGLRSLLCIPLTTLDRPLGILWADASRRAVSFDREHLELLSAVAGIVSPALANARRTEWLEAENRRIRSVQLDHEMVGESPAMERVFQLLSRVAATDLTVLVLGESGTGKELVAKAIHRNSPRAEKPFIAINCATLSETLLESELFGHERGAFTGAVGRKIGQFELAHEGTVFLDEVGEIPLPLQARLLRALETREIQRVGGSHTIRVDVRVVAATNRDLEAAIGKRTFREDLYHRLNVFSLTLPPLRGRRGDLPLLASHFTARSARRLKRPVNGLSPAARAAIAAYDWPGNVRELRNAIERAVVLAGDELLRPEDLPEAVLESAAPAGSGDATGTYHQAVARAKRRILRDALRDAGGSYSATAKRLGLNRTYLHRLITNLKLRSQSED